MRERQYLTDVARRHAFGFGDLDSGSNVSENQFAVPHECLRDGAN